MSPIEYAHLRASMWKATGDDHMDAAVRLTEQGHSTAAHIALDLARKYREWSEDALSWAAGNTPHHRVVSLMLGTYPGAE